MAPVWISSPYLWLAKGAVSITGLGRVPKLWSCSHGGFPDKLGIQHHQQSLGSFNGRLGRAAPGCLPIHMEPKENS